MKKMGQTIFFWFAGFQLIDFAATTGGAHQAGRASEGEKRTLYLTGGGRETAQTPSSVLR